MPDGEQPADKVVAVVPIGANPIGDHRAYVCSERELGRLGSKNVIHSRRAYKK